MNDEPMTPAETELARERIKQWPLEERRALTRMGNDEAKAIMLLTALLDIRPTDHVPDNPIEIDLRGS